MGIKLIKDVKRYCDDFDIPINHIVEVISDRKVIPMLRGKAFEFSVTDFLVIGFTF